MMGRVRDGGSAPLLPLLSLVKLPVSVRCWLKAEGSPVAGNRDDLSGGQRGSAANGPALAHLTTLPQAFLALMLEWFSYWHLLIWVYW